MKNVKIGDIVIHKDKTWLVFEAIKTFPTNDQFLICVEYFEQKELDQFLVSTVQEIIELPKNVSSIFLKRVKKTEEKYLNKL